MALKIKEAFQLFIWRLFWGLRAHRAGGLKVDDIFPDFALKDTQGNLYRLSAEKKKTALWFTNLCESCRERIPWIHELQREGGFRILAVSILEKNDPLPYQMAPDCAFPILLDPEDIVERKLGLAHAPSACPLRNFFVLSQDGKILLRHHLSAIKREDFQALWKKE